MRRSAALGLLATLALTAQASAADRVSVADPAGGARWTAQQAASGAGTCVTVRHGTKTRPRLCSRLRSGVVFSYDLRSERASSPRATRTILIAQFHPDVVRASVRTPDGVRSYRRRQNRPRVLLVVLSGRVERPPLTVQVRRGSRTITVVNGSPPSVQVADPLGGAPWRSRTAAASGGGDCVAWERVPPRYADTPEPVRGAARCGPSGRDLPVTVAQAADGRLVVFGLAGPAVRSAVVRLPDGTTKPLALEEKTRALLAVLRGNTDPVALRVVATLADGRQVEQALDVAG
jgi:hypothetical protein